MKLNHLLRENRTDIPGLEDLRKSGIPFVIVGAVASNVYIKRKRNTEDIDVLSKDHSKLARYIHATFPQLTIQENDVVIRFAKDDEEIIDIMKPYNRLFLSVLQDSHPHNGYDVASPEALIAMKFAAIMSKSRKPIQKEQDRVDIAAIIMNTNLNMEKIKQHVAQLFSEAPDVLEAFIQKLRNDFEIT